MANVLTQLGNWNTGATNKIFGTAEQLTGFGKAMGGLGINAGNIGGIANTIGQIGTGLLAGQNETGIGNAMQTIGGLASNIPGVGGLIGAGVGVVGGLVNAAFGSHINEEFVQQTQLGANQLASQSFNANTNGDLLNDWQNTSTMSNVSKSDVGSDGLFGSKASDKTDELNRKIDEANQRLLANFSLAAKNVDEQNDLRILQNMAAYGGPINSFRKYYDKGGYLAQAKALIRQNEGWNDKPYSDTPRGKQWRSVGYGFNDSGFREKYPEGISKHYEHGITKKQAEEELDYFLNKAEKQLKSIYGKQWNDFTDSQKAAILDTYYQRPTSVGKSSRFYKAVTAGEDAGRYLGVAGYNKRNKIRQGVFGGGYSDYGDWSGAEDTNPNSSSLQEVTPIPVVQDLDLSSITPTEAKALELNLASPTYDLSMFGQVLTAPTQQATPTIGTVEDFLSSYGNFEDNLFKKGGSIHIKPSHKGRLTALKKRTGKSEAELYRTGGPAVRKMITFARNARKWKHEDGGELNLKDMNIFDFGGGLTHGSDWDTGINWVNEGGSHGENPLGGVQMGVDEQGIPNLVEEGEAVWNGDYVFSKRMKVPKKLAKKYSLGGDMTFADAIAKLTKDSEERPLSNIDRATNDHILGEFADTQEEMRMAKAQRAMDKEMQLRDDFLTGFQFGLGGYMSAAGIVPDADNLSPIEKKERLFADGGYTEASDNTRVTRPTVLPTEAPLTFEQNIRYNTPLFKDVEYWGNGKFWQRNPKYATEDWFNLMKAKDVEAFKEDYSKQVKGDKLRKAFLDNASTFDDGGYLWDNFWSTINKYSKQRGNSKSKYKIAKYAESEDAKKYKTIKDLEDSKAYSDFTDYMLGVNPEHSASDEERLKYFRWIDDNTGRERTYTNKAGELLEGWQDKFKAARTDGLYGIQHYTPTWQERAADKAVAAEPRVFHALEGDNDYIQGELSPEIGAETRRVTLDNGDTVIYHDRKPRTGETLAEVAAETGLTKSPFKPKQTWTRYAPLFMSSLFGLKEMLTPPDYGNADAITAAAYQVGSPISVGTEYVGDYRRRDPFDERYLMNIINQRGAATNQNMMNLSGGNRAVAMSGILANDLTNQMSLAEAARQSYLANRTDDAQVSDFNYRTNKGNADAQNQRNLTLAQLNNSRQGAMLSGIAQGARLRQAIKDQRDAAISANFTNLAQGLGDLGKENGFYNMLGGLNEEGVLKYFYGDNWKTKFNNVIG